MLAAAVELGAANCVDPSIDAVELAASNPMLDGLRRETKRDELRMRDDPMLPSRESEEPLQAPGVGGLR